MSSDKIVRELRAVARPEKAEFYPGFFQAHPGGYGEGDRFLGVVVPDQRKIAKKYRDLSLPQLSKLLASRWHEARLTAVYILVLQFEKASSGRDADPRVEKELLDFYLSNLHAINNWDLVDASAPKILGSRLLRHPEERSVLDRLAASGQLWEERISIVANYSLIKADQFEDFFRIVETLITHPHDLIHKAIGWMLREVWKRDTPVMERFLAKHLEKMPRTALRYAIEKMPKSERDEWLKR